METFTELLDKYLELREMDERDHPDYVDGYTCKQYFKDIEDVSGKLNAMVHNVNS